MPSASRWLHYGLTSNDVVDTAQALQLKQASRILPRRCEKLASVLKRRALELKHTVQIGRTHGIHAEPITFGLKVAIWYDELGATRSVWKRRRKICVSARFRARWARSRTSGRMRKRRSARGWG